MAWTFHLNINNQTDRKLETSGKDYNLKEGTWYRDNKDNRKPTSVDPGENKQVLGIRAANGTWTGYECTCTWRDTTVGRGNYGTIDLYINVPFAGGNKSSFETSGLYKEEGWKGLPESGTSFKDL